MVIFNDINVIIKCVYMGTTRPLNNPKREKYELGEGIQKVERGQHFKFPKAKKSRSRDSE